MFSKTSSKLVRTIGARYISKVGGKGTKNSILDNCDTVVVGFTDIYGRLLGKRFDIDFYKESVMTDGTHGCTYLLTCDMDMTPQDGFEYSSWKRGYGDFHLVPDESSLRPAAWLDRSAIILCDVCDPVTHELVSIAPRSVLKKQVEEAKKQGLFALAASELEYYIYENSYREARKKHYHDLVPIGDYLEDYHIQQGTRSEWLNAKFRKYLKQSNIPVEGTKGEAGLGQHELNIKYSEIVDMCDRHIIYKQCLKEVSDLEGVSVTFMAKPFTNSTGSGCHIHLSLWNNNKYEENAFLGKEKIGNINGVSKIFKYFLGGWIKHTPEIFPFYAPTINSYKRFVTSSWAPTKLAWSYDNRSAGFRIVGHEKSLRIEMRISGADVNPYLIFAGALASGLDGIKNEILPSDPLDGNIYHNEKAQDVPNTLGEAVRLFRNSKWANDTFGEDVVEHYSHFYGLEQKTFDKNVTDWERKRYFEMI